MKVKLIYNPITGGGIFPKYLDFMIDKFQSQGIQVDLFRINNDENLYIMLSNLNVDEYSKILIAGGDGTVHTVVNGLIRNNIDLPIGIFPIGMANNYACYFNLPNDIEEICDIVINNNYTLSDVGIINDKFFINVASFGFLTDISEKTDRSIKNNLAAFAYYLKGIKEFPKFNPISVSIDSKEFTYNGDIFFMLIMNGKSAGGFKKITPAASIEDGLLDVIIFKKCPTIEMMTLFLKVINGQTNGQTIDDSNVIHFKTDNLTIDCNECVETDIDGEKGPEFPLNISVLPKKLKILTTLNNENGHLQDSTFNFSNIKNALDMISKGAINGIKKPFLEVYNRRPAVNDLGKIIKDIPRHNSFIYLNKLSLDEEYFKNAKKSLYNGYIYIILSATGSPAGETIRKFIRKDYTHASLSFDEELKTIVSYNGGNDIGSPGLNNEMLEFFNQKEDSNIIVYKLKATKEQKKKILNEIERINKQGSSYNTVGLVVPYSFRANIMVCSQFVYTMLKLAKLDYFEKTPEKVRPTDFVELDYERKLEFISKVYIKDILD